MLDVGGWWQKKSILNVGTKIALGGTAACLLLYTTNKKS
jgi:hypothetical protein